MRGSSRTWHLALTLLAAVASSGLAHAGSPRTAFVAPAVLELTDGGASGAVVATVHLNDACVTEDALAASPRWICESGGVRSVGFAPRDAFRGAAWSADELRAKKAEVDASTRWYAAQDPAKREALRSKYREDQFTWLARLCVLGANPTSCLLAMQLRVEAEADAQVARRAAAAPPAAKVSCDVQRSHLGLATCLGANDWNGLAASTRFPSDPFVLVVAAPPSSVRVVTGAWAWVDGATMELAVSRDTTQHLPVTFEVLQRALAAGHRRLVLPPSLDRRVGRGTDGLWRSLPSTQDGTTGPVADGAVVLCADVVQPLGPLVGIVEKRDLLSGEPYLEYQYRLPCAEGWVLGRDARVGLGRFRSFPLARLGPADDALDPGGRYVDGQRRRAFGAVTYREVLEPDDQLATIYRKTCFIEYGKAAMKLGSSYGCQLEFAGDLNRDGLADFVIHSGQESCEEDSLYLSSPAGWQLAAGSSGCE